MGAVAVSRVGGGEGGSGLCDDEEDDGGVGQGGEDAEHRLGLQLCVIPVGKGGEGCGRGPGGGGNDVGHGRHDPDLRNDQVSNPSPHGGCHSRENAALARNCRRVEAKQIAGMSRLSILQEGVGSGRHPTLRVRRGEPPPPTRPEGPPCFAGTKRAE